MQAIIPVAGAGTRLRPLTYTQPKVLISVAGKPILAYIIENLLENVIVYFHIFYLSFTLLNNLLCSAFMVPLIQ